MPVLAQPLDSHWTALKRILRYLKGSMDFGLTLQPAFGPFPIPLQACFDDDWVSDMMIRGSHLAHAFILAQIWFLGGPQSNPR